MLSILLSTLKQYFGLIKYLLISVFVYIYILTAIYVLVDFLQMDQVLAYLTVYIPAYILEYTMTLSMVFNEQHRWSKVLKYIGYVAVFLGLSTLFYKLMLSVGMYYLLATLLTAVVLMPVRFMVNKYWVYG
jgi:putative flippase GtrA